MQDTNTIEQYPAIQCTNCGKFKVQINDTLYVLNGREGKEDSDGLWVEDTPNGPLFSLHQLPNTQKWKVIHKDNIGEHQQKHQRKWGSSTLL